MIINSTNFDPFNPKLYFYTLSVLLENGFSKLRVHIKNAYRVLFLILALTSLIVGNSYKAIFTIDITLPIPEVIAVQYFHELTNWSIAILPYSDRQDSIQAFFKDSFQEGGGLKFKNEILPRGLFAQSSFGKILAVIPLKNYTNTTSAEIKLLKFLIKNTLLFRSSADALNYISRCNKIVFAGTTQDISVLKEFNHKTKNIKLGTGKDELYPNIYFWQISTSSGEFVKRRMAQLLSSGIYSMWEHIYYSPTREQISPEQKINAAEKQKLDSNLGPLFIIYIVCILVTSFAFLIDILKVYYNMLS